MVMRTGRVLLFLVVAAFLLCPPALLAASKILSNVPVYLWYHGCAPTSGGMIMAYWDAQGYSNLAPGDGQTYNASVEQTITSTNHENQSGGHDTSGCSGAADSISCFMHTNPSTGSSSTYNIRDGLEEYASSKGYSSFDATARFIPQQGGSWSWSDFVAEIDADRPVEMLLLRKSGGDTFGHAVTAYGYETSGANYMVVHDTWGGQFGGVEDWYGHSNEPNGYDSSGKEYWEWVDWNGSNTTYSVAQAITFTDGGAVPEPSTISLFFTGSLLLFWFRKRESVSVTK